MAKIEIQIVSDFVCAWCYVAKKSLDKAIFLYRATYPEGKHDDFTVSWMPYYLNYNPFDYPADKKTIGEKRLQDKLSQEQETPQQPDSEDYEKKKVERAGRAMGIDFKWGGKLGVNPATRDAHRLVYLVGKKYSSEVVNHLIDGLFHAYQCQEQDIAEHDVLREAAQQAGISDNDIEGWLQSDEAVDMIDEAAANNKNVPGLRGVPTFIIKRGSDEHKTGTLVVHDELPQEDQKQESVLELLDKFIEIREVQDRERALKA